MPLEKARRSPRVCICRGQVAVAREDRAEHREAVERGVRGEHEDEAGDDRDEDDAEGEVREHRLGELADRGVLDVRRRRPAGRCAAAGLAGSSAILTPVHWLRAMIEPSIVIDRPPMSSRVVAALSLLGFLKAGTPFEIASTPVSAAQPEENARSSRKAAASPVTPVPDSGSRVSAGALGRGERAGEVLDEAVEPHPDDGHHEGVDRHREGLARLAHAAQVHRRQEGDERDRDDDLTPPHEVEDGRGVLHARRDRHRDGEHVVDEQRARHGEPRLGSEVDGRNLVVAATRGVGVHVLAVRRDHDDHDEHDRDRDAPAVGGDERPAGETEHEHDLVGRVGHRRERVAREDREREPLGQKGLPELVAAHRATEEEALEQRTGTWHDATL